MNKTILQIWNETVNSFENVNTDASNQVYDELVLLYSAPDRIFHTFNHIEKMLKVLNQLFSIYSFNELEKNCAILSTFFHDACLNPSQEPSEYTDEEMSATSAIKALQTMNITNVHVLNNVYQLISLTGKSEPSPNSLLETIFIDSNRSVYGVEKEKYINYMYSIWAEYINLPFEIFVRIRTDFLNTLLDNNIFYTEYMKEMFHDQAVDNITNEISLLYKLSAEDLINKVQGYV